LQPAMRSVSRWTQTRIPRHRDILDSRTAAARCSLSAFAIRDVRCVLTRGDLSDFLHQAAVAAAATKAGACWKCFVVGCSRSGTTRLSVMLDRHSRLAMTPETAFYSEIAPRLEEPGRPPLHEILAGWYRLPELGLTPQAVVARCGGREAPGEVL